MRACGSTKLSIIWLMASSLPKRTSRWSPTPQRWKLHTNERFEEFDEYVVVLRVLTREEIEEFIALTAEIKGKWNIDPKIANTDNDAEAREREWQERHKNRHRVDSSDEEDHPALCYRSTTASATTGGPQVSASTRQRLPFPNRPGSQA
jgi:hypothetical protein